MQTRVTMKDIAAELGVAASTVSRALRREAGVSAQVRDRILAACERRGYRPNPLVSALMANRSRMGIDAIDTVALLTNYESPESWQCKDVCRWAYSGILRRAGELGFRIEVVSLAEFDGDAARMEKMLRARGIRGVLLGFSRVQDHPALIDPSSFCIAGLSAYFSGLPVDRANFHGFYNVQLALMELRKLGYRRTALVTPEFNNRVSNNTWSGAFLDYQRSLPESERCNPFIPAAETYEEAFNDWLDRSKPDSLLVYKSPVRELLKRRGLRVPEDLGVAYLYGTSDEMGSAAGIDGNMPAVGAAAFDLVVEKLNANAQGIPEHPKEVLIKGDWHQGATVQLEDSSMLQNTARSSPVAK